MLNDKRSRSQSITYKVLYALAFFAAIVGSIFSFDLYLNEYDSELAVFDECATLYAYNILSFVMVAFCIIILFIPKLFSCAENELAGGSLREIFMNSFCGIFCLGYPAVLLFEKINTFEMIDKITILTAILSVVSSFYFFFQMFGVSNKRNTLSVLGMCFAVFCIIIIFTVHYNSSDILITSPVRISSLLSFISIMLFILSEVRFYIGIPSHSMLFSFGTATMYFGISSSLPKLYLSLMNESGFGFTSKTILIFIELLCGIYAAFRLSKFLFVKNFCSSKALDEEKEEMYEMITEMGFENVEKTEKNENAETFEAENEAYMFNKTEDLIASEHDLPEDVGFVGGEEGKFVVEDYESIESETDDYFDEDEISPFEGESIENSIKEAIDESAEDLGELIIYEKKNNSSSEEAAQDYESALPSEVIEDIADPEKKDHEDEESAEDEEDDENEIEEDINRIIDEMACKQTAEEQQTKEEDKSKKLKFRFVKKM